MMTRPTRGFEWPIAQSTTWSGGRELPATVLILTIVILVCSNHSKCQDVGVSASKFDVTIDIKPIVCNSHCYVAANQDIEATTTITGNHNESAMEYKWFNKDGLIPNIPPKTPILKTKFTQTDTDNFVKVLANDTSTNTTDEFESKFTVLTPIVVSDPVGKLFLEFGELLDVNLTFTGSPPFTYCYRFCTEGSIIPCNFCLVFATTNERQVNVRQYLHQVGNYTLLFRIANRMNEVTKLYAIKINDTTRQSTLPIAPIVSSILAVCILIAGVALHLRFKDISLNTETANFDFFHDEDEDDWEEELSFIQRVRYLLCRDDQDDADEVSAYLLATSKN